MTYRSSDSSVSKCPGTTTNDTFRSTGAVNLTPSEELGGAAASVVAHACHPPAEPPLGRFPELSGGSTPELRSRRMKREFAGRTDWLSWGFTSAWFMWCLFCHRHLELGSINSLCDSDCWIVGFASVKSMMEKINSHCVDTMSSAQHWGRDQTLQRPVISAPDMLSSCSGGHLALYWGCSFFQNLPQGGSFVSPGPGGSAIVFLLLSWDLKTSLPPPS